MIEVKLKGGQVKGMAPKAILAAARRSALVGAEVYTEAVHDFIDSGQAFTPRTGNLQQGIGWRPDGDGGLVFAQGEVAEFLEFGTKPHVIKARNRRALKIPTPDGYKFRRAVRHPGFPKGKFSFFYVDEAHRRKLVTAAVRRDFAAGLNEVLE